MYSVRLLWPCCIMVEHKSSLCVRLPSEPGRIPELLLDTAVPLSEEAPDATTGPHPRDLPEDPIHPHDQAGESLVLAGMTHDLGWPQMMNTESSHSHCATLTHLTRLLPFLVFAKSSRKA